MTSTVTTSRPNRLYFRSRVSRPQLLDRYVSVRAFSEKLAEPLQVEDYVVQSMEDASPTKWHLAHTTWFFETFVLRPLVSAYSPAFPEYAYLFNSYYVQAGERYPRPMRGLVTRPTVAQVFDYRRAINREIVSLLENGPDDLVEQALPVIEIGLHHEQQHQELMLTDLKHLFSFNPLHPVYVDRPPTVSMEVEPIGWKSFPGGIESIGHDGEGFCFDNELPRHRVLLGSFELADRLITNGEYLEFIDDGGYETPTLWLNEGWQTALEQGWKAPLYWKKRDDGWWHFTLNGLRRVNPSEPVCHVSHFEADAYARWAGARLATEQEWEVAATQAPNDGNFAENGRFHPLPLLARGSRDGARQLFGDVWEWTQSPYLGYPGYRPMKGALGEYNGKFMSRQVVLRGGSCATPESHIRATYRNFFPPTARWQFSGVRLCRSVHDGSV